MNSGYFPIHSHSQNRVSWHLFRAGLSLCGAYSVQETDELEPERVAGRRYCGNCTKFEATEQRLGLPPEPALSEADKKFIDENWATLTSVQIAEALGRKNVQRVRYYAKHLGGTKQIPSPGLFKLGQMPHNWKPEADEFLRKTEYGIPYLFVRGGKFGFQHKHVAVWTAKNGPLPAGHCVTFRDGNTLNCDLENLELVTRTELLERNSGRAELTDEYVAELLSRTGRGTHDETLREVVKQVPELLEVKKNQLRLKRSIKQS